MDDFVEMMSLRMQNEVLSDAVKHLCSAIAAMSQHHAQMGSALADIAYLLDIAQLPKSKDEALRAAIGRAQEQLENQQVIDEQSKLAAATYRGRGRPPDDDTTERVGELSAANMTLAEIGEALALSVSAVSYHRRKLKLKEGLAVDNEVSTV